MLKKIAALLLTLVIISGMLVGCGGGTASKNAAPEKEAIPLPDYMIPAGVESVHSDTNKSSAYYESKMTLEEVKAFYFKAFEQLEVYETDEFDQARLKAEKLVPEGEADSQGDIVWAYYGKYKLPPEPTPESGEAPDPGIGHAFVICSQKGDTTGVEIAVAYRAVNMATAMGLEPITEATVTETETDAKA